MNLHASFATMWRKGGDVMQRLLIVLVAVVATVILTGCERGVHGRTMFTPPPPTRPAPTATPIPANVRQVEIGPTVAYTLIVDGVERLAPTEIGGEYDCEGYSPDRLLARDGQKYTFLLRCLWSTPGKTTVQWHDYEVTATMQGDDDFYINEMHIIIP